MCKINVARYLLTPSILVTDEHNRLQQNVNCCDSIPSAGSPFHIFMYELHGSHIFRLTNFPDFSNIFFPFSSIFPSAGSPFHIFMYELHGSHIFRLTNFPDTSNIFFPFSSIFSMFYLINLTNTKIYLTNTSIKRSEKTG